MIVLGVRAETWSIRSRLILTRTAQLPHRSRNGDRMLVAEDNVVNQKVAIRIPEKLESAWTWQRTEKPPFMAGRAGASTSS